MQKWQNNNIIEQLNATLLLTQKNGVFHIDIIGFSFIGENLKQIFFFFLNLQWIFQLLCRENSIYLPSINIGIFFRWPNFR